MSSVNSLNEVLRDHMMNASSGWSMGSFGALAEFVQDQDEPVLVDDTLSLTRATARGAIRLRVDAIDTGFAYETTVKDKACWSHGLALCVNVENSKMGNRNVLTELGGDDQSIRPEDAGGILFDMGLGAIGTGCGHVDFCIRTTDEDLIALLRDNEGKSILDPSSPAMPAILKAHPHRIAITPIGRIEVYQPIGGPDTNDESPEGPHTHILPQLIKANRSHSANIPIPDGLVPCAFLHPANPVHLSDEGESTFDPTVFEAFQNLLETWGDPEFTKAKLDTWNDTGSSDQNSRNLRKAIDIAVRQAEWFKKNSAAPS